MSRSVELQQAVWTRGSGLLQHQRSNLTREPERETPAGGLATLPELDPSTLFLTREPEREAPAGGLDPRLGAPTAPAQ